MSTRTWSVLLFSLLHASGFFVITPRNSFRSPNLQPRILSRSFSSRPPVVAIDQESCVLPASPDDIALNTNWKEMEKVGAMTELPTVLVAGVIDRRPASQALFRDAVRNIMWYKENMELFGGGLLETDLGPPPDIDEQDQRGLTALHWGVMYENKQAVETLLTIGGADPNQRDAMGFTPLHYITGGYWAKKYPPKNSADIVHLLIKGGAQVNSVTDQGVTPLHGAVMGKRDYAVKVLLQFGANPTLQDEDEISPVDLSQGFIREKLLQAVNSGYLVWPEKILPQQKPKARKLSGWGLTYGSEQKAELARSGYTGAEVRQVAKVQVPKKETASKNASDASEAKQLKQRGPSYSRRLEQRAKQRVPAAEEKKSPEGEKGQAKRGATKAATPKTKTGKGGKGQTGKGQPQPSVGRGEGGGATRAANNLKQNTIQSGGEGGGKGVRPKHHSTPGRKGKQTGASDAGETKATASRKAVKKSPVQELNEWTQQKGAPAPEFTPLEMSAEGHVVTVKLQNLQGTGICMFRSFAGRRNKVEARNSAASQALAFLRETSKKTESDTKPRSEVI